MLRRRLREESGYTLVEVIATMVILAIAILPMVSMFDTGIRAATAASNYDKARTLANLKLEEAKGLPFDSTDATVQDVNDNFPGAAGTTTAYNGNGYYQSVWKSVTGPATADFTGFEYRIEKQYMAQPVCQATSCAPTNFATSSTPTKLIRVTVTVRWGNGNTYTTLGLVTG